MRLLMLITFLVRLSGNVFSQNDAFINVEIKNTTKDSLTISLKDKFYSKDGSSDLKSKITSNGRCQFIIKNDNPVYAVLHTSSYQWSILISPKDSVTIRFDDMDFIKSAKVSGKQALQYNYFLDYIRTFDIDHGLWYDKGYTDLFTMEFREFKQHRKEKLLCDLNFKNKYFENSVVPEEFKSLVHAEIFYSYYNSILSYASFRKFFQKKEDKIDSEFYSEINDSLFNNDNYLISPMYKEAVFTFIFKYYGISSNNADSIHLMGYNLSDKHLFNKTRLFMKSSIVYSLIKEGRKNAIDDTIISEYKKEYPFINTNNFINQSISFKDFVFVQDSTIDTDLILKAKNTILIDTLNNEFKFCDLLIGNKGKVIYLDFWRSSCGPCKAEMPHSADLIKKMEGENVKFIYISTDDKNDRWMNAIHNWRIGGKNYRLKAGFDSELCKLLQIVSIPRYILIDKDGLLSYPFALQPSDTNIINQIKELTKK